MGLEGPVSCGLVAGVFSHIIGADRAQRARIIGNQLGKEKHVKTGASDALTYLDILSDSSCSGSVSHHGQSQGCVNDPADDPVLMTLCTLL